MTEIYFIIKKYIFKVKVSLTDLHWELVNTIVMMHFGGIYTGITMD